MPAERLPLSAFLPPLSRRLYAVEPDGFWWRVFSAEGEVARYRTQMAALEGAQALVQAMRWLGLEAEVMLEEPAEAGGRPR